MTDDPKTPNADLSTLLDQLEAKAGELPAEHRDAARGLIAKLRAEVGAPEPHGPTVKAHVNGLSTFAGLVPVLNALANRLSGAGI